LLALGASLLLILSAFFTGLAREKMVKWTSGKPVQALREAATPQQQADALRLMDEVVKAKYEERYDDALRIVADARRADPRIPGAEIVSAEIALRRNKSEDVVSAAQEAIRRGENEADAKLLLALDVWMSRGRQGMAAQAGAKAEQLLDEASMDEQSNGEVRFFLGDLQHMTGQPAFARRSLLAGLYRLPPWSSSQFILAKMQLLADEVSAQGQPSAVPSTLGGRALLGLRGAARSGQDPLTALNQLASCFTTRQVSFLVADPASAAVVPSPALKEIVTPLMKSLPGNPADQTEAAATSPH